MRLEKVKTSPVNYVFFPYFDLEDLSIQISDSIKPMDPCQNVLIAEDFNKRFDNDINCSEYLI